MSRRSIDREKAKATIIVGRRCGLSLSAASKVAGVHVATACRWQNLDPEFAQASRAAEREYRIELYRSRSFRRPIVSWRRDCPLCWANVEIRRALGWIPFWRCWRWPKCPWASWRPRYRQDCPRCGGPQFWSHSRKSVGCDRCRNANKCTLSAGRDR